MLLNLKVQGPCGTLTERATCLCERGQSELVAHSDDLAKNVQIQVQDRRRPKYHFERKSAQDN